MTRLVTEEIPTSATKMRALRPSAGRSFLSSFSPIVLLHRRLTRAGGPVTDARDGLYNLRLRRVALDLGSQPADVDVYVTAGQIMRARGDGLGDLGPRESLPRTAHQQRQDLELRRRQVQGLSVAAHGVAVRVELQRPQPDDAVPVPALLPPEPAQDGLDPRLELLGVEGLGYVVVRPELEAHQVQGLPPEYPQRLDPVLRRQHPIPFRRQHDGGNLQEGRVVVYQQNRLFQAPLLKTFRAALPPLKT